MNHVPFIFEELNNKIQSLISVYQQSVVLLSEKDFLIIDLKEKLVALELKNAELISLADFQRQEIDFLQLLLEDMDAKVSAAVCEKDVICPAAAQDNSISLSAFSYKKTVENSPAGNSLEVDNKED